MVKDHPRVCGEKQWCLPVSLPGGGSPPRVRGKVSLTNPSLSTSRITPACAGKRLKTSNDCGTKQDHPRVCGEKLVESTRETREEGSPPRVRGKDRCMIGLVVCRGITPACAGKRISRYGCKILDQDHPRVCGEKTKKSP